MKNARDGEWFFVGVLACLVSAAPMGWLLAKLAAMGWLLAELAARLNGGG